MVRPWLMLAGILLILLVLSIPAKATESESPITMDGQEIC